MACSLSNISIGGTAATDCKGPFDGNDTGAGNPLLTELNKGLFNVGAGVTWTQAGKSDDGGNDYGFKAKNDFSTGDWGLGKSFVSDPVTGLSTFVISLKTSTAYSAYLFKDIDLSKTGLTGIFNTIGVALDGSGNNGKALSHASLFIAKKPDQKKVPEPSIIFGLSALAAGSLAMKKKSSNSALQS
ncbi:PEP-CTERM sorting domain-containing protein [Brunnivagina elsteri CCALA 953]|uniref:PEP-CTERM sorting domain-containing protein n=1 Tax=Brunnivagina elsteri CCALA 953 TaxID=987040 RepID=A0A2A2TMB7_9CYAN|nr:PEP-CTERM sorting domain-containing protein [Calothrix elsteri CCALA 953]